MKHRLHPQGIAASQVIIHGDHVHMPALKREHRCSHCTSKGLTFARIHLNGIALVYSGCGGYLFFEWLIAKPIGDCMIDLRQQLGIDARLIKRSRPREAQNACRPPWQESTQVESS